MAHVPPHACGHAAHPQALISSDISRVVDRPPSPVYSNLTQITLFISGFLRDAQKASRVLTTARERLHAGSWSGGIDGDDSR